MTGAPLSGIERIAVLRANGLGDFMFALPALEALRAAYPGASITLLAREWHRDFLRDRPSPVDDVIALPDMPGIGAPEDALCDPEASAKAIRDLRRRHFDLAIQLHGGGGFSNPFVRALGAGHTVGLQAAQAVPLDRNVPFRYFQSEVFRLLEVVGMVGGRPVSLEPRVECIAADAEEPERVLRHRLDAAADALPHRRPLVAIHPAAGDGRRRWPVESFGRVAYRLALEGATVVVLGAEADRDAAAAVTRIAAAGAGPAGSRVHDLSGCLSLGGLAGLLHRADVLVANDSGPLHLARAVGTATVGIFWCGNLINAGPLGRSRHRPLCSWRLECPVCGVDCIQGRCDHHESFVAEVPVEEVAHEALSLLRDVAVHKPQQITHDFLF